MLNSEVKYFFILLILSLLTVSCGNDEEDSKNDNLTQNKANIPKLYLQPAPFEKKLKGAVIITSIEGNARVMNLFHPTGLGEGNEKTEALETGDIVLHGSTIISGKNSEVDLLFTNGTSAKIGSNTKLTISAIWQKGFQKSEIKVSHIKEETSPTRIDLDLEIGDLIVDVKKLKKESSFRINSSLGIAGIRGTQFRIFSESKKVELSVHKGEVCVWAENNHENEISTAEKLVLKTDNEPILKPLSPEEKLIIQQRIASLKESIDSYDLSNLANALGANSEATQIEGSDNRESSRFEKIRSEIFSIDAKIITAWKLFRKTGEQDQTIMDLEDYLDEIDNETKSFSQSDAVDEKDYRNIREKVRQLKQTWKGYTEEVKLRSKKN